MRSDRMKKKTLESICFFNFEWNRRSKQEKNDQAITYYVWVCKLLTTMCDSIDMESNFLIVERDLHSNLSKYWCLFKQIIT